MCTQASTDCRFPVHAGCHSLWVPCCPRGTELTVSGLDSDGGRGQEGTQSIPEVGQCANNLVSGSRPAFCPFISDVTHVKITYQTLSHFIILMVEGSLVPRPSLAPGNEEST